MQQISPKLLNEWKKEGELIAIWRCERCFKKIPFYKTDNELVNMIYLSFARHEKFCFECKRKLEKKPEVKKKIIREIGLLKKYEGVIIEEDDGLNIKTSF